MSPGSTTRLVLLRGTEFEMGSNESYPDGSPVHRARVGAFEIDRHPVTNAESAAFVTAADLAPGALVSP